MANPCPCELVANEPTADSSSLSTTNQVIDDDSADDYVEQVPPHIYPLIRQAKSLTTYRRRFKRPSWATVGKRSPILIKKRPSWAQVG